MKETHLAASRYYNRSLNVEEDHWPLVLLNTSLYLLYIGGIATVVDCSELPIVVVDNW